MVVGAHVDIAAAVPNLCAGLSKNAALLVEDDRRMGHYAVEEDMKDRY